MPRTIAELARLIDGRATGDPNTPIHGITNRENPGPGLIAFAQDEKGLRQLEVTEVACIIAPASLKNSSKPLIQVANPKLAWAKLLREFHPATGFTPFVSPQAYVAKTAKLGKNVTLEPFAVIQEHAEIGEGSVIRSHAFVGEHVRIGKKTMIGPSVVLYDRCEIGSAVIIHGGSVIGADGFGYVSSAAGHEKIPQVGNVVIEDEVEIGANVTVDRATVGSTKIGRGSKIDNLVQIAHNVTIGPHTVISAQTGISGSCKIGAFVTMGGKVGLGDHVEIGDGTMVGAGSGFPSGKKVPPKQIVFGEPARPYQEARRQIAAQWRSAEMLEEIKKLRTRVAELEKQINQPSSPS